MLTDLSGLIATLITLSVAAERLVSIIKNFSPSLSSEQSTAEKERARQVKLQLLALAAGLLTAYLADVGSLLPAGLPRWPLLGLLASGGSGFWTSVLGYVNGIKDIKKNMAIDTKVQVASNIAAVANGAAARPLTALDSFGPQPARETASAGNAVQSILHEATAQVKDRLSNAAPATRDEVHSILTTTTTKVNTIFSGAAKTANDNLARVLEEANAQLANRG